MNAWIILLIGMLALLALYLLAALIVHFILKREEKLLIEEVGKVVPIEKDRISKIDEVASKIKEVSFLPKNITNALEEVKRESLKEEPDIFDMKNKSDFLVLYFKKFIYQKNSKINKEKADELQEELDKLITKDTMSKDSPYYSYNKRANKFNAIIGMSYLMVFSKNRFNRATIL